MRQWTLFLLLTAFSALGGVRTVQSIAMYDAPKILPTHEVCYTISITFDTLPTHWWNYIDQRSNDFALDFYSDSVIFAKNAIMLTDKNPFTGARVIQIKSNYALSGVRSIIFINGVSGWRFVTSTVNNNQIKVEAIRPLPPADNRQAASNPGAITTLATIAGVGLLVIVAITLLATR